MNDLEKARALILDRNTNLTELAIMCGLKPQTLRVYRMKSERLKKMAWENIHKLAEIYDERQVSKMRKVNKFDRLHVASRLLNILNSENVDELLNVSKEELIVRAFPIEESFDSEIMPQYTKKTKEAAMDDIYELADQRKGKIWGVFSDVRGLIEENCGFTGEDLENYRFHIMNSPVNMANFILQAHAHTWVPYWIKDAVKSETLTKENLDTVKDYLAKVEN